MDDFDQDRLLGILEMSSKIAMGKNKKEDLSVLLEDFDEHLRAIYVNNLINLFRNGMSLKQDIEVFSESAAEIFKGQTLLPKALRNYWKIHGEAFKREFWQLHPFDNHLTGLKWVALLPSDSKFGLYNTEAKVRCMFETTGDNFSMDFSPAALVQLSKELESIQNSIPKAQ